MLSHENYLFVVRDTQVFSAVSQTIQVQVYDVEDFSLVRCITFPTTATHYSDYNVAVSMASWFKENFVVIGTGDTIYRVEMGGRVETLCTVGSLIAAMVNSDDKLLVLLCSKSFGTLYGSSTVTLKRLTKRGLPVSDTSIKLTLYGTWNHALLLPNGHFIISVSDYQRCSHYVTWYDHNGTVMMTCGSTQFVGMKFIDGPKQVAFDKKTGRIMVADCFNNRIVVIYPKSQMMHELQVAEEVDLQNPYALCFDESRDRLYIGESIGGFTDLEHDTDLEGHAPRLIVLDNVC